LRDTGLGQNEGNILTNLFLLEEEIDPECNEPGPFSQAMNDALSIVPIEQLDTEETVYDGTENAENERAVSTCESSSNIETKNDSDKLSSDDSHFLINLAAILADHVKREPTVQMHQSKVRDQMAV
ncbi:MAG: hypothetical protein M1829_003019, partial [Trizodia sp. TS-e1964]